MKRGILEQWVRDSWLAGIPLSEIEVNIAGRAEEDFALTVAIYRSLEQRMRRCTQLLDRH